MQGDQALQPRQSAQCCTCEPPPCLPLQIVFKGLDQHSDLRELVADTLTMKPNFSYTIDEVRDNVKRVFNQGYFQSVKPIADDTRDGVKLTLEVCAAHADLADTGLSWQQQVSGGSRSLEVPADQLLLTTLMLIALRP